MHNSKLSAIVIDCKTDDLAEATRFWSAALRREVSAPQPGDERYRDLVSAPAEPIIIIQRVEHDSRAHLDIESDDIEAEVARLEGLGAKAVARIHTWVVMEAPTGQRFCVVRQQRPSHVAVPFNAPPEHQAFHAWAGHYNATTRTFLEPGTPPAESQDTLYVEAILGGRWLRMQWFGSMANKPRQGEMQLGFHVDAREYELSWVDTFHTGSAMMWSRGKARADGLISVTGSYGAGADTWGWRTELKGSEDGLSMRAINIAPTGEEYPAIEADWQRRHPGALDDLSR